jgi:hypothetical protein
MLKRKMLFLTTCSWCREVYDFMLSSGLEAEFLNAGDDANWDLANELEDMLGTIKYPIIVLDYPERIVYLYRVDNKKDSNVIFTLNDTTFKIGCYTVDDFIENLKKYK